MWKKTSKKGITEFLKGEWELKFEITPDSTMILLKLFLSGFVFCLTGLVFSMLINSLFGIVLFVSLMGVVLVLSIVLNEVVKRKEESESQMFGDVSK